ncbi:hypothetical protein PI23P_09460 [Polaribacter irgensii 23-P]|uniref:NAD(P)-binding domain-containing protein n=1 Tax=Polaribacter irgensii 23-P TaxID=313594 RepID=A4C0A1_9FLAO|nr:NAD(P)H-binding protein [Polaribacter irgensii]EAR12844.1 hypothetical protein PI23P_09460 [Polaribacter irgensii 23-P]
MGKTAIVLGATGLTGGILLEHLIADSSYDKIKLFSRSSVGSTSKKVEEYLVDMLQLELHSVQFTGDEVFCCIGTTATKTPDKKRYKLIDYGIPVSAAKLAKQNGIQTFIVLSSMGADSKSTVFYSKTKGEMERDVLLQNVRHTFILRPSLIGGHRNEHRLGEKIGKVAMGLLNPFLTGEFKKYRIIHPDKIVKCMKIVARNTAHDVFLDSHKILTIANSSVL